MKDGSHMVLRGNKSHLKTNYSQVHHSPVQYYRQRWLQYKTKHTKQSKRIRHKELEMQFKTSFRKTFKNPINYTTNRTNTNHLSAPELN